MAALACHCERPGEPGLGDSHQFQRLWDSGRVSAGPCPTLLHRPREELIENEHSELQLSLQKHQSELAAANVLHTFYRNQAGSGEAEQLRSSLRSEAHSQGKGSGRETQHLPADQEAREGGSARSSSSRFVVAMRLNGSEDNQSKNPRME